MAHEEQNDPVAQSTSNSPTTSTADLSERDNKEIPVVKEEKKDLFVSYQGRFGSELLEPWIINWQQVSCGCGG